MPAFQKNVLLYLLLSKPITLNCTKEIFIFGKDKERKEKWYISDKILFSFVLIIVHIALVKLQKFLKVNNRPLLHIVSSTYH